MTFKELHVLREQFWKLNKQELSTLMKMVKEGNAVGASSKLLAGVEEFLRLILNNTTDQELQADVKNLLRMATDQNSSPFANMDIR